jgi:YHS domain-containing protein
MARDSLTTPSARVVADPVCGTTIDASEAVGSVDRDGRTYYFCSTGCLERFKADPAKYTGAAGVQSSPVAPTSIATPQHSDGSGVEYTCPMHPQIVSDRPGTCPICGMALEPRTITAPDEGEESHELRDMTRRFRVSAALSVPLLFIAMAHDVAGDLAPPTTLRWFEVALATPVVLWGGWPFFVRAWQSLLYRSLNMFTLIGLGVSVAYVYRAQAKVGIAMGTGTDVAMESAGVTLVKGDLTGIVRARRLSRATMANIEQNLFFAFVYNTLGVPLAAGVLYPFLGLLLSPMVAAAAMSFSSVSVIANALRLRTAKV